MKTALHSGDLGDTLAVLPVLRALGGVKLFLCTRDGTKGYSEVRFNTIKPLLEIQPYIHGVERYDEKTPIDYDFTDFRSKWHDGDSLAEKQARWIGIPHNSVDLSPWITIPPAHRHGKIVQCRSQRCLGSLHWFRFFHKAKECIFLGVQEDYDQFCLENSPWLPHKKNMPKIEFRKTENLLEAAMIIRGARLCVMNQTANLWLSYSQGMTPMLIEKVNHDSFLPMDGRRYVAAANENPSIKEFQRL